MIPIFIYRLLFSCDSQFQSDELATGCPLVKDVSRESRRGERMRGYPTSRRRDGCGRPSLQEAGYFRESGDVGDERIVHPILAGVSAHSFVKLLEESFIFFCALLLRQTDGLGPLDHNFSGVGLGFDDLHGLVQVVGEGHGARVRSLFSARELGLNIGRNDFENLYFGGLELVAQRFSVGVDGSLGGIVGGRYRQGQEGEDGGDGDNGGVGLLFEMRKESRSEADGAEKIGGDDRLGIDEIFGLGEQVFEAHDAGALDDCVEGWKVGDELGGKGANADCILDVQNGGGHTRVRGDGVVE